MCISGYSLGDRLLMDGTLTRSLACLEEIVERSSHSDLHDSVLVVAADSLCGCALQCCCGCLQWGDRWLGAQGNLATGDVQYENRWYSGWSRTRLAEYCALLESLFGWGLAL